MKNKGSRVKFKYLQNDYGGVFGVTDESLYMKNMLKNCITYIFLFNGTFAKLCNINLPELDNRACPATVNVIPSDLVTGW